MQKINMENSYNNVFYVSNLNIIGGVETFLYEIAKKYKKYDITIFYKSGYQEQIDRLRKYVRIIKYTGEKIKCKKLFLSYDYDIAYKIDADEYYGIVHGSFKSQHTKPKINNKINYWLGVSENACKEWTEITGLKCELCRNPLTITKEEEKEPIWFISCTRLSPEKGGDNMIKFIKGAEDYCKNTGCKYNYLIFSDQRLPIETPNIIYCKPKLDIRNILSSLKGKCYGIQLSKSEGDCYFTRECEAFGIPIICTNLPSLKEQGIKNNINGYVLDLDMENIPYDKIFNNMPNVKQRLIKDTWETILDKTKNTYNEEINKKYLVEALDTYINYNKYDIDLGRVPEVGEQWEVDYYRLQTLLGENEKNLKYVRLVNEESISNYSGV